MVKPDFYGVVNGEEIQVILPQASEEYGPISHYLLIVVPEDKSNLHKNPDQFLTEEMIKEEMLSTRHDRIDLSNAPYIAAMFISRNIPYTFHLGSGDTYQNFTNKKLERYKRYRIFVRAVVDTPQKHLYTSSPFSEFLSLDMREAPRGEVLYLFHLLMLIYANDNNLRYHNDQILTINIKIRKFILTLILVIKDSFGWL